MSGGVGVGITLARVEGFVNLTVSAAMRFCPYNPETNTNEDFQFQEVQISLGLGLTISMIAFDCTIKPIEVIFTYDGIQGEWKEPTWKSSYGPANGIENVVTELQLPRDFSEAKLYSPHEFLADARQPNALLTADLASARLSAYNTDAPFQVSGYGGSASAFPLIEGQAAGYDFRVVTTANGENYVLYTVGNSGSDVLNRSRLVLSRLVATGSTPGLVNPTDPAAATPYIVVDDDAGGDLECAAWAEGNTIRAAWVSYGPAAQGLQSTNAADLFREAAGSRVVKTAVFNTTETAGFTERKVIGGDDGGMIFLPAINVSCKPRGI